MFTALLLLLASLFTARGGDPDPDADDTTDAPADDTPPEGDDDTDDEPEGAGGDDNDLDPEALRRELEKVRREAANRRRQLREREEQMTTLEAQNQRILEALGITTGDDDEPDATAEAERLRQENRRLRTQNRFDAVAREAGADSDLTWGYLLARGEIDSLDPDHEDFATTLRERIDSAIEAKPGLKVTAPTPPAPGPTDLDSPTPPAEDPADMSMSQFMEWRKKNRNKE